VVFHLTRAGPGPSIPKFERECAAEMNGSCWLPRSRSAFPNKVEVEFWNSVEVDLDSDEVTPIVASESS
jgi:hypothetical protein